MSADEAHDRALLDFLADVGADTVRHNLNEDLLPHLIGTRDLLRSWGARGALCDAGLFHSVYGTEYFATETLSVGRRDDVREVIGEAAEAIVWLWCFGVRLTLRENLARSEGLRMRDRRTAEWLPISASQFEDLVNLWIADTLEQLPRVPEREVATARTLLEYQDRALPLARAELQGVLARVD